MNLQEELKALNEIVAGYDVLKQRISELEEQVEEQEKEFPQDGDEYWYIDDEGYILNEKWDGLDFEEYRLAMGNIFKTKDQADFAVKKLKVEAELRKFSRPFEYGENNHIICVEKNINRLFTIGRLVDHYQGAIYFESKGKAEEAIRSVGAERIEKYIFGVED